MLLPCPGYWPVESEFWTMYLCTYANADNCVTAILGLLYSVCIDEPNVVGTQEKKHGNDMKLSPWLTEASEDGSQLRLS